MIASINPASGEELVTFDAYDADRVDALLTAAAVAQSNWRWTEVSERTDLLTSLAETLRSRKPELAALDHQRDGQAADRGGRRDREVRDHL